MLYLVKGGLCEKGPGTPVRGKASPRQQSDLLLASVEPIGSTDGASVICLGKRKVSV